MLIYLSWKTKHVSCFTLLLDINSYIFEVVVLELVWRKLTMFNSNQQVKISKLYGLFGLKGNLSLRKSK